MRHEDPFITWGMTFHILVTLELPTSNDLWTSRTFELPNDLWNYIWILVLHVFWTSIHGSFVHTWLFDFHFFFFTMITSLHHNFHIIMWCGRDKSLSLMTWTHSDWWHGLSSMGDMVPTYVLTLACNFRSLMYPPSKGSLISWILQGASIIKAWIFSSFFNASFIYLIFLIFFMHAFHVVPKTPITAITHGKQPWYWKISYSNMFYADFMFVSQ